MLVALQYAKMEITPTTDPGSPSKEMQQVASENTNGKRTIEDRKYAKGAGTEKNAFPQSLSMPTL